MMRKIRYISLLIGFIFILISCRQEKMLFYPKTLPADYRFAFRSKFSEYYFKVDEKTKLDGLLFQADSSKGLIFYLHGNAGNIDSWGNCADTYLANKYDFFIL